MAARKRNPKKAIPRTKAAFKKEYYDLLTKYVKTRQYLGAGRYATPTSQSLEIADRLGELYDAHPGWADDTDDEWGDDQRMNNPVDWRGAGRKAWGGARGAAAKAAHAAKVALAKTKVKSAESKIKSLKSCAGELDVLPSELASTKSMKTAQRSLAATKENVKRIQADRPKGKEEDASLYLYENPRKPTGIIGKSEGWVRQQDGSYYNPPFYVVKERGKLKTTPGYKPRSVVWNLYEFSSNNWNLMGSHRTLTDAKRQAASDYTYWKPKKGNPSRMASLRFQHTLSKQFGGGTLQYYRALKKALDHGMVSPGSIVGSGYKSHMVKKVAHRYLDEKIAKLQKKSPQRNPRKKAPTRRTNAMATKKISSFRGDEKRVAKGMMTKGYRYYLKAPRVPAMYAKTIKVATELIKDFNRGYGSTFGIKGAKVYKLVK